MGQGGQFDAENVDDLLSQAVVWGPPRTLKRRMWWRGWRDGRREIPGSNRQPWPTPALDELYALTDSHVERIHVQLCAELVQLDGRIASAHQHALSAGHIAEHLWSETKGLSDAPADPGAPANSSLAALRRNARARWDEAMEAQNAAAAAQQRFQELLAVRRATLEKYQRAADAQVHALLSLGHRYWATNLRYRRRSSRAAVSGLKVEYESDSRVHLVPDLTWEQHGRGGQP